MNYAYSLLQWKYLAFYCVNRALMVDDMLIVHFSSAIYLKNHLHLHFMTVQEELHFKEFDKPHSRFDEACILILDHCRVYSSNKWV